MSKVINLNQPVKEICDAYPEAKEILKGLGFVQITNPMMLKTMGKVMTLTKGSAMMGVDIDKIKKAFEDKGYEVKD
ncbi:DUF1858 domain-containing protein [Peptococcaceae bacterium 1198_IL3148]